MNSTHFITFLALALLVLISMPEIVSLLNIIAKLFRHLVKWAKTEILIIRANRNIHMKKR
jgi:hypothetical protein